MKKIVAILFLVGFITSSFVMNKSELVIQSTQKDEINFLRCLH